MSVGDQRGAAAGRKSRCNLDANLHDMAPSDDKTNAHSKDADVRIKRWIRTARKLATAARSASLVLPRRSEETALQLACDIGAADGYAVWEEPNRAGTKPLHIAGSGTRYSTITGVAWLDDRYVIAAHRSGLRVGVFDTHHISIPVWTGSLDHLVDDIAAKRTSPTTFELAVSGCWENIHSRYELHMNDGDDVSFQMTHVHTEANPTRDFAHGVAYDRNGELWSALHTGQDPRVITGDKTYRIPAPWGVRDCCDDPVRQRALAIAVSANPKAEAYDGVATTIWAQRYGSGRWECIGRYDNIHADCLDVTATHIWIPDQLNDRLIGIDAATSEIQRIYRGSCFDFPHGLHVSSDNKLAVSNYGSSSIAIIDLDRLVST